MLTRSIVTAIRQLSRNPITSGFNIAGLAVGITTFTLILFYIQKERSYDRHNVDADDLYRIVNNYAIERDHNTTAWVAPELAESAKAQVPGIVEAVRLFRYRSPVVIVDRVSNKNFMEPNSIWADANVFRVFTFEFIEGDADRALERPNTMVITESMARKYFDSTNVVGNVLLDITMNAEFEITAVVQDLPATSHVKVDFLCSLSSLPSLWGKDILKSWTNSFLYTYIKVDNGATPQDVEMRINELYARNVPANDQYTSHLVLQPVTDIHLHSNVLNEWQPNSDIQYVYILTAVAGLILLVSAINYINLWIARSERRMKEIGIRQAIGGSKLNLGLQFTIESLTHVALALLLCVIVVRLVVPIIDQALGETGMLSQVGELKLWLYIFLGVIMLVFVVMLYPVKIIASMRPVLAIKGTPTVSRMGLNLWEGLIAFQILVTTCLITGTLFINKQVTFMEQQPPGYDIEHLVNISQLSNTPLRNRLKEALISNSNIKSTSGVSHLVGGTLYQQRYEITISGHKQTVLWQRIHTDYDFCKTYDVEIVAGRDFSALVASDSSNYLINESAARALGLEPEEAVGLDVYDGGGKVIGVMKDFHFKTLHSNIEPLVVHIVTDRIRMLTVNIGNSDLTTALQSIRDTWRQLQPEEPFIYETLTGLNAQNYRFEEKFGKAIMFFTFTVFLLSVSGLVSLNIYIANLRKREIGIRKILGAETSSLLVALSKRFAVITIIGIVLSLPLSWYAMNLWLLDFAYHIDLTAWIFIFGGLATFLLSMVSITMPSLRTARQNPVAVLRSGEL